MAHGVEVRLGSHARGYQPTVLLLCLELLYMICYTNTICMYAVNQICYVIPGIHIPGTCFRLGEAKPISHAKNKTNTENYIYAYIRTFNRIYYIYSSAVCHVVHDMPSGRTDAICTVSGTEGQNVEKRWLLGNFFLISFFLFSEGFVE